MSTRSNFFITTVLCAATIPVIATAQPAPLAEPSRWALAVDGPCARVPGFEEGLALAIPQGSIAPAASAEMQIRVQTSLEGGTGHAEVAVFDSILQAPAGSRTITSDTPGCAALAEQLHLVIGLLVEAGRGAPAPAPPPPPQPPPETPAPLAEAEAPAETRPPPAAAATPPPRRIRIGPQRRHKLGLVATVGWGLLPRAYPGVELRWDIAAEGRWPIRLAGAFQGPSDARTSAGAMRLLSAYASLGTCPEWPFGRVHLGGCALLGLGAIRADNVSFTSFEQGRKPLVLLTLEAFLSARIAGPLELVFGVQASGVPFIPQFAFRTVQGVQTIAHQPTPVSLRGHGGIQLRFR